VGLCIFTDRVEYFLPPRRGKSPAMRALRELIGFKPQSRLTAYRPAFQMLSKVLKRRSVLFVISDFTEPIPMESASVLAQRNDLVAAVIHDPLEKKIMPAVRLTVRDPETGRVGYLSPNSAEAFLKAEQFRESQLRVLTAKGADRMDLQAGENVVAGLMKFFKKRIERMGRR
jgi:uncharacterized protein (DUF58 family)